jgi:hypothetical protein
LASLCLSAEHNGRLVVDHRLHQPVFIAEVVIERALARTRRGPDIIQAGARDAPLADQRSGSSDDSQPRRAALLTIRDKGPPSSSSLGPSALEAARGSTMRQCPPRSNKGREPSTPQYAWAGQTAGLDLARTQTASRRGHRATTQQYELPQPRPLEVGS